MFVVDQGFRQGRWCSSSMLIAFPNERRITEDFLLTFVVFVQLQLRYSFESKSFFFLPGYARMFFFSWCRFPFKGYPPRNNNVSSVTSVELLSENNILITRSPQSFAQSAWLSISMDSVFYRGKLVLKGRAIGIFSSSTRIILTTQTK